MLCSILQRHRHASLSSRSIIGHLDRRLDGRRARDMRLRAEMSEAPILLLGLILRLIYRRMSPLRRMRADGQYIVEIQPYGEILSLRALFLRLLIDLLVLLPGQMCLIKTHLPYRARQMSEVFRSSKLWDDMPYIRIPNEDWLRLPLAQYIFRRYCTHVCYIFSIKI